MLGQTRHRWRGRPPSTGPKLNILSQASIPDPLCRLNSHCDHLQQLRVSIEGKQTDGISTQQDLLQTRRIKETEQMFIMPCSFPGVSQRIHGGSLTNIHFRSAEALSIYARMPEKAGSHVPKQMNNGWKPWPAAIFKSPVKFRLDNYSEDD